jgi:hypothetical protein
MGLMVPVNEVNGLETAMGLGSEVSEEEAAHLGQEWQEVPVVGKGPGLEVVAEELLVGEPVAADAILPVKPRYFLSIGCQFGRLELCKVELCLSNFLLVTQNLHTCLDLQNNNI